MKTLFKKKSIACDTHTSDSMEFLMLATAAKLPDDLTYHPDVKWMQVVHSAFNPVKKCYITPNGKRKCRSFVDYISIRLNTSEKSSEMFDRWRALPNYIDTWYSDNENVSSWYFMIPAVES